MPSEIFKVGFKALKWTSFGMHAAYEIVELEYLQENIEF